MATPIEPLPEEDGPEAGGDVVMEVRDEAMPADDQAPELHDKPWPIGTRVHPPDAQTPSDVRGSGLETST